MFLSYKLKGKYRDFLTLFMLGLRNPWVSLLMYSALDYIHLAIVVMAADLPFTLLCTFSPIDNTRFFPLIFSFHITSSPPFTLSNFFLSDLGIKGAYRLTGADLSAAHGLADEERWGLYYGVKALSKNDPEAQGNRHKYLKKKRRKLN